MPVTLICGLQWGDEGKGKLTHYLSAQADLVGRFAGGPNSGHTVVIGGEKFATHVVPVGIFQGAICLCGPGMVIDPVGLVDELVSIARHTAYEGRLFISEAAHLIFEYHRYQDGLNERARGKGRIGTTLRGIGPAYADKANRIGIRAGMLSDPARLREAITRNLEDKNRIFTRVYEADPLPLARVLDPALAAAEKLSPLLADVSYIARQALAEGKRFLLEGNQGAMLDIDHGTYPFVTSSSCVPASGIVGFGLSPVHLSHSIGIAKAYTTRVGEGPMPTLQDNAVGELIRERGHEYGATTGRPRSCGWLDLVALRHAVGVSGVQEVAITLLDVLDAFDEISVCTAYRTPTGERTDFPADTAAFDAIEPVYATLPGWETDITGCRTFDDLPQAARGYLRFVESFVDAPVTIVSVGPGEEQTIARRL
jgi:adenylosuccinate synthase